MKSKFERDAVMGTWVWYPGTGERYTIFEPIGTGEPVVIKVAQEGDFFEDGEAIPVNDHDAIRTCEEHYTRRNADPAVRNIMTTIMNDIRAHVAHCGNPELEAWAADRLAGKKPSSKLDRKALDTAWHMKKGPHDLGPLEYTIRAAIGVEDAIEALSLVARFAYDATHVVNDVGSVQASEACFYDRQRELRPTPFKETSDESHV